MLNELFARFDRLAHVSDLAFHPRCMCLCHFSLKQRTVVVSSDSCQLQLIPMVFVAKKNNIHRDFFNDSCSIIHSSLSVA